MMRLERLRKTFRTGFGRSVIALRHVDLEVEPSEIHGFLGPNGAGKSTTIKTILGLIRPDGGSVTLFGKPISDGAWRARIGYMPELPSFYEYLTGLELVTWFGRLTGMSQHEAERAARRQLERVGLEKAMKRRIRSYSKGMLQRAGLAQALLGSPALLILDEPMTGLDPIGRKEMRELILALREEGKTVFYSTHILPDIEMTCNRVTIIDQGITRRTGRLDDILTETTRGVTISLEGLSPEVITRVREKHPSLSEEGHRVTLDIADPDAASALVGDLVTTAGARVIRFEPHREDLETIFVRSLGSFEAPEAVGA